MDAIAKTKCPSMFSLHDNRSEADSEGTGRITDTAVAIETALVRTKALVRIDARYAASLRQRRC
jgi:hypothetical protein